MEYVLGVDAGNTKTIALVARIDGAIAGTGRAGCGDIYGAASAEAALAAVEAAVAAALRAAGLPAAHGPPPSLRKEGRGTRSGYPLVGRAIRGLVAGAFSMAGADWPEDFDFLRGEMHRRGFGRRVIVVNDALGALRAGSPDGTGVVVVCGTGVATGARAPDGRVWHSSFWQEPHGSSQLAGKALRAVYRADLGIDPPTALTARVLAYFGQPTVEHVLHLLTARRAAPAPPIPIAGLARALLDEAHNGDATARAIVLDHGASLGDYALVAARRVGLDGSPFPLVLTGGVLRHPTYLLREAIVARVRSTSPSAFVLPARFEPAVGATLLALEAVGVDVTPRVLAGLTRSLPPDAFFAT